MRGQVYRINRMRGMVAIATADHGFTIIELKNDDDIEVGDMMSWTRDTVLGSETYFNDTKGRPMNVYVQNHGVSPAQLNHQLLL